MKTFEELFTGNMLAFGKYVLEEKIEHKVKREGKASTITGPVTPELYQRHIDGSQGLGIVPINKQGMCVFGAIDIDIYPLDIIALNREVRSLEYTHENWESRDENKKEISVPRLPLVVCRTKSGGAHLYLFCEPTEAKIVRETLKSFAVMLRQYPCEIFPKQDDISGEKVTGNWINLPYFGPDTDRYALDRDGEPLSFDDFVEYANSMIVSDVSPLILNDGPPCLQRLAAEGFPSGTRNTTMFNIGQHLKLKDTDNWEDRLEEINRQRLGEQWLRTGEILELEKSLKTKDYKFQCKEAPLEARCQRSICETRAFGISSDAVALTRKTLPSDAVILPGGDQAITTAAMEVFTKLEGDGSYIRRNKFVYKIDAKTKQMDFVGPDELRSRIETAGKKDDGTRSTWRAINTRNGIHFKQDIAKQDDCRAMLASPAVEQLMNVKGVSTSPIILSNGHVITHGITAEVLILCDQKFTKIPVDKARADLLDLLRDYKFRSSADKSRCVAAMITPLLRMSGLVGGHSPIWVMEADQSHAGKTKLAEMVFAIYGDDPVPVISKQLGESGVGGMTESIGNAFLKAKNFVFFDNLRAVGAFENAYLEAAVTRRGTMPVRVPYCGEQDIDVSRVSVVFTANDLSLNRDLANRANMVMIEKHTDDYQFHNWGTALERHVMNNSEHYFNCVASIVQSWITDHGSRESEHTGLEHDFRDWAAKMDYICRQVLDLDPPFHRYREVQHRKINTEMSWLEKFCDTVGVPDEMTTKELFDLSVAYGIDPPAETYTKLGFVLKRLMKGNETITVNGELEHDFAMETSKDTKTGKDVKRYMVLRPL